MLAFCMSVIKCVADRLRHLSGRMPELFHAKMTLGGIKLYQAL